MFPKSYLERIVSNFRILGGDMTVEELEAFEKNIDLKQGGQLADGADISHIIGPGDGARA